ncbi:Uncharacterised protein [Mycobacterium tuberculosis]|nr:Uncharacterised protein [Mycobacterium tuberculosis]
MVSTSGRLRADLRTERGRVFVAARRSARCVTNTSEATPVAASTRTDSSPIVSHPRRSTSATLTTFLPWPISYAISGKIAEIGSATRDWVATTATKAMVRPTPIPRSARGMRLTEALCSPMRAGSRRSTRAKVTIVTVSTRIWVSARSGAPLVAKSTTMPRPVTEASTTPV